MIKVGLTMEWYFLKEFLVACERYFYEWYIDEPPNMSPIWHLVQKFQDNGHHAHWSTV
jgi:hypothetical protein